MNHDDPWMMERAVRRDRRANAREERRRRRWRQNALAVLVIGSVALGAVTVAIAQVRTPPVVTRHGAAALRPQPVPVAAQTEPTATSGVTGTVAAAPAPVPKAKTVVKRRVTVPSQSFAIAIGAAGYKPSVVRAKAGVPVTLVVAKGEGCAAGFLMPSRGIAKDNTTRPVTVRLGKLKAGVYPFSCGMEMVQGRLIVS